MSGVGANLKMMFGAGNQPERQQTSPSRLDHSHLGHRRRKELSSIANVVVAKCGRILFLKPEELKKHFEEEVHVSAKEPSSYARNFLEYCCFRALSIATQVPDYLSDKEFRRLTFDIMIAWEAPAATNKPSIKNDQFVEGFEDDEEAEDSALFYSDLMPLLVGVESTVGRDAFVRLAPIVPQIADMITVHSQFEELTSLTGGRLPFPVYDNYIEEVDKAIRTMKTLKTPSLVSSLNLEKGEMIIDIDGTVTTQPVLQHISVSSWPGRLTLTDRALYFEATGIVSYDKAQKFDLSADSGHSVKPDLSGPWGARLFDKAIMYRSTTLSEPVVFEFPELTGHTRRDYWLAIIREIILTHQFIRTHHLEGISKSEALARAVLGIVRLKATREVLYMLPSKPERLLTFSSAEQLPGGDFVLQALAEKLCRVQPEALSFNDKLDRHESNRLCSSMAVTALSYCEMPELDKMGIPIAEVSIGELTPLEKVVLQSRNDSRRVELAQATIDGVKLEGIGKNIMVLQELVKPLSTFARWLQSIANWEQPIKTTMFCLLFSFIIYRDWVGYLIPLVLAFCAGWILWLRHTYTGNQDHEVVIPPSPSRSTLEQLMKLQQGLSQIEELVQKGNISLLKLRALVLSTLPQTK
ncbi:hypothetical protein O6H91_01G054100 [Diphasiastrum complanatum]|uniref:Uncharacterized protein n=1 Tax=Diphasiastrum complanatum TaxID=34168 RepID=A0ACC2ERA8_DIPCM|nr:hypothetical protein O6H91_01G054100 [Diphasiastrum complanatum]